jgi:hypothetical protein
VLAFILGLLLIFTTLLDGYETILLPRRINHRFRFARIYYRSAWRLWRTLAMKWPAGKYREAMLSAFGPFSLLILFVSWISLLVFGFTLMQWALNSLIVAAGPASAPASFVTYLYYSGSTYFTLGLGDVLPAPGLARLLTIIECGLGFGFLAIIISYIPVLYQAFSRREVTISLLDARAGSPPTGGAFLQRLYRQGKIEVDNDSLREWERWCAELLESHISFPVLAFYRSQHANQSWLTALAAMLDSSSLLMALLPATESHQARLTFAMARHAAVDISLIFSIRPENCPVPAVPAPITRLDRLLAELGFPPSEFPRIEQRFAELRRMYQPFLEGLGKQFIISIPPVVAADPVDDNWQRSAWMPRAPGIAKLPAGGEGKDHFD